MSDPVNQPSPSPRIPARLAEWAIELGFSPGETSEIDPRYAFRSAVPGKHPFDIILTSTVVYRRHSGAIA